MIDSSANFAKGFVMKLIPLFFTILFVATTNLPSFSSAEENGLFRHVVSFQFKEGTTEEKKAEVVTSFMALKSKIDAIVAIEWGGTENIEPLNDGFTHTFLVSFKDKAGLELYLPHPAHEEFKKLVKPLLEKVYVFDYTAKD